MKLELVKQGKFLGTTCDFYKDTENDDIYMSRTQIGYALGYSNPANAILIIHKRHKERLDKFSIEVRSCQFDTTFNGLGKDKKAFMYTERGIYAICGWSNKEIAEQFNDWVYDTIISIRKNGYYIAESKDEKWLGVRKDGKIERLGLTDEIKEFVQYAMQHGSHKPERYYIHFTKLVNKKLDIPSNLKRDDMSQEMLRNIMALEIVISMKLPKLISKEMNYKEIYQEIKKLIEII